MILVGGDWFVFVLREKFRRGEISIDEFAECLRRSRFVEGDCVFVDSVDELFEVLDYGI